MVFHVLDAGHLATRDDSECLAVLRACLRPDQRVAFVLNKIDLLDGERGEDLQGHVEEVAKYLLQSGFPVPMIVPTTASIALYARLALQGDSLTRVQSRPRLPGAAIRAWRARAP